MCVADLNEMFAVCGKCGRTTPISVVDSEDEQLTPDEEAAAAEWGGWYTRFNDERDEYEGRCPSCVPDNERHLWTLVADDE